MPNEFLIKSNDTENGYIYRELNNRMARLEKNIEGVFNLLNQLEGSGITIQQLTDIIQKLDKKADVEYVKNHIEDSVRHLNDVKVMDWDMKYEKPINGIPELDLEPDVRKKLNGITSGTGTVGVLKYRVTVGNAQNNSFSINHNLGTTDVYVSVWDLFAKELVTVDVGIIDVNSVKVNFLKKPDYNQYRVIVIG
jgi:uncharacterized protein (DUF111 family)